MEYCGVDATKNIRSLTFRGTWGPDLEMSVQDLRFAIKERAAKRSRSSTGRSSPARTVQDHDRQKLPFNACQLSRDDLKDYMPMFALYLDIQKRLDIEDLNEKEVKGRWKSFFNKWYAYFQTPKLNKFPENCTG